MNREIFVDTSAWVAVTDRRDKFHAPAQAIYTRLLRERQPLVTTNLVIAETYIIIRRAAGHTQALRLLRALNGSPRLARLYTDAGLDSQAEHILAAYPDQDFSLADAVSFAVMQARGIQTAFSFDRHFLTLGFHLLTVEY